MTKRIRLENADPAKQYRIMVHTQELLEDGWKTTESREIFPIELKELIIHSHKRIIVQEVLIGPTAEQFNETI